MYLKIQPLERLAQQWIDTVKSWVNAHCESSARLALSHAWAWYGSTRATGHQVFGAFGPTEQYPGRMEVVDVPWDAACGADPKCCGALQT